MLLEVHIMCSSKELDRHDIDDAHWKPIHRLYCTPAPSSFGLGQRYERAMSEATRIFIAWLALCTTSPARCIICVSDTRSRSSPFRLIAIAVVGIQGERCAGAHRWMQVCICVCCRAGGIQECFSHPHHVRDNRGLCQSSYGWMCVCVCVRVGPFRLDDIRRRECLGKSWTWKLFCASFYIQRKELFKQRTFVGPWPMW